MSEETLITVVPTTANPQSKVLCFTSNRVIVADVHYNLIIYVLGGLIAGPLQYRTRNKKAEALSMLSPESILTDDKKNFAVPYAELDKVELKMKGRGVRIIAGTAKYEFWLNKPQDFEDLDNKLRPVLADKLVVS